MEPADRTGPPDDEPVTEAAADETAADETAADETAADETAADETAADETTAAAPASDKADEAAPDPEEAGETAPASDEAPPDEGAPRGGGLLGWLIPALAGVLVVLLVLIAVFGYRVYDASRLDQARSEAVSAATVAATDVLAYDYRHLDKDFAKAKRHLAPDFAKQYTKTTTTLVRPTALKTKAVVTARVIKGSVVTATRDRVVTLLFVNQTSTSTLRSGKRTDLTRVRMTMQRADDRWLVARIQAL